MALAKVRAVFGRFVVRDELWRAMGIPAMRKLDADLRLSRAAGTIQVLPRTGSPTSRSPAP